MKIHIDIRSGIDPEDAVRKVAQVINGGRISKDNTKYCFITTWADDTIVCTRDYRKSDCFVVYKKGKFRED